MDANRNVLHLIEKYILDSKFAAAADIAKVYVVHQLGGIFLDIDVYFEKWDNELLYVFDSLH